jgi:hypothetical protein
MLMRARMIKDFSVNSIDILQMKFEMQGRDL